MRSHYFTVAGLTTVGFSTEDDSGTELTALTLVGVTESLTGRYTVDVPEGVTVNWYEGATFSVSERVVAPLPEAAYTAPPTDYAKPGDVQITVPAPTFSGTVSADMTPVVEAIAAIPAPVFGGIVPGDVLVTPATLDDNGDAIGITTGGATVTAYLRADTARTTPKRHTTAESDGDWSLALGPGVAWTLWFDKDGYESESYEVTT